MEGEAGGVSSEGAHGPSRRRRLPFSEYVPAQRRDRILTRISEARSAVPGWCGWTSTAVCIEVSGLGFRAEWSTGRQRAGRCFNKAQ